MVKGSSGKITCRTSKITSMSSFQIWGGDGPVMKEDHVSFKTAYGYVDHIDVLFPDLGWRWPRHEGGSRVVQDCLWLCDGHPWWSSRHGCHGDRTTEVLHWNPRQGEGSVSSTGALVWHAHHNAE